MWTTSSRAATDPDSGPWIHSRRWDLVFLFASAALVALPLCTYYAVTAVTGAAPRSFQENQQLSIAMLINLGAAFGIGGPHMYATFTTTLLEKRFRQRHRRLLWCAAAIPPLVITLAVLRIEILMAVFFAWASVHVIHQLVYLVQQYQDRAEARAPIPAWSRAIDYVLAMSCLYPVATWRLLAEPGTRLDLPFGLAVHPGFHIGRVNIAEQVPALFHGQTWIATAIAVTFGLSLAALLVRTGWELATHRFVLPRTLILLTTAPIAFCLPLFDNMDVALQGFNLWHSTQYIGLVWLMNLRRAERGEISSPLVQSVSGSSRSLHYYAFVVAISLGSGAVMGVLHYGLGLPMLQVYYCVLLSGLWIHYLWDHVVFQERDALAPSSHAREPIALAA